MILNFSVFKIATLCLEFAQSYAFYHSASWGVEAFKNNIKAISTSIMGSYGLFFLHYLVKNIFKKKLYFCIQKYSKSLTFKHTPSDEKKSVFKLFNSNVYEHNFL